MRASDGRTVGGTEDSAPEAIGAGRWEAVILDMDGVITDTASVHTAGHTFSDFLRRRADRLGESFGPCN